MFFMGLHIHFQVTQSPNGEIHLHKEEPVVNHSSAGESRGVGLTDFSCQAPWHEVASHDLWILPPQFHPFLLSLLRGILFGISHSIVWSQSSFLCSLLSLISVSVLSRQISFTSMNVEYLFTKYVSLALNSLPELQTCWYTCFLCILPSDVWGQLEFNMH